MTRGLWLFAVFLVGYGAGLGSAVIYLRSVHRITVQVVGAVRLPGTYRLPARATVADALQVAGGLTEEADLSTLDLFAPLTDGQVVEVPARAADRRPPARPAPTKEQSLLVNVNTATREELMQLPGIGPKTADAIIRYRETYGPFRSPEDLLKVKGIGPKKLEQIRPFITF